jgi:hypothetical protein
MRRTTTLLAAALATLTATPATASNTRTATDQVGGVRFTLHGSHLALTILAEHAAGGRGAAPLLRGHKVRTVCGISRTSSAAPIARAAARWPRHADRALFLLDRDLAARARWCLVEGLDGEDIAAVDLGTHRRLQW